MAVTIRKTWHVVRHRKPLSPIVEETITYTLVSTALSLLLGALLIAVRADELLWGVR